MTCLLGTVLSILATLIPSLVAIVILWWLDRYEKEPLWLLTIVFLWGAVPTIIMSLVFQIVLDLPLAAMLGPSILYEATGAGIIAPLTEETFKALIILAVFLVYGVVADNVALSLGIWDYDRSKILNVWVLGMPLEEIIFCVLVAIAIASAVLLFADREDKGFKVSEFPRKFFKD